MGEAEVSSAGGVIANEIRKYWIALHNFLGNCISAWILILYCHVLSSFSRNYSWLSTVPLLTLFLFYYASPSFLIFHHFWHSGLTSSKLSHSIFNAPYIWAPCPSVLQISQSWLFSPAQATVALSFFKCRRTKEEFSCLWELTSLNFIVLIFWSKEAGFF